VKDLSLSIRAFRSRDCLVIIYGSITTICIAICLRHTTLGVGGRHPYAYTCEDRLRLMVENIFVHHHLGTYPQYMVVSVYLQSRNLFLAVEMLAEAQISTCVVESSFLCSFFDIYIISIFNCHVKNYFWNAVNNLIVLVSAL